MSVTRWPRISVVTVWLDEGLDLGGTVESVAAQAYPALEHIIVGAVRPSAPLDARWRYPHLAMDSEGARGRADALNRGFRLATGEIVAVLNPDDALLPGALHRVAGEIDPARGRHVVMGRCRLVDADGRFTGIEHPSHFESHRRVLEIWKGHTIPRPAVFWTAEAWRACGPLDDTLPSPCVDYDLLCRLSRRFPFHGIDAVLAQQPLRIDAGGVRQSEAAAVGESIRVSRRYWGSPLRPRYWRLAASLARHRLDRAGRARRWLGDARTRWQRGAGLTAVLHAIGGAALGPEVAFYVALYPGLRDRSRTLGRRALDRLARTGGTPAQTAAYLDRTEAWEDGWVGPRLVVSCGGEPGARMLRIRGIAQLEHIQGPIELTVSLDGRDVGRHRLAETGAFAVDLPLPAPLNPGAHRIEVRASQWFIPDQFLRNGDVRPLSWRFGEVRVG